MKLRFDKLLKMPLALSGGRGETVLVRHKVKQTIRIDLPIFDLCEILGSLLITYQPVFSNIRPEV